MSAWDGIRKDSTTAPEMGYNSPIPKPVTWTNHQQTMEAIAALADGLRARDKQISALAEQVRLGFEGLNERVKEQDAALRANLQQALNYKFEEMTKLQLEWIERVKNVYKFIFHDFTEFSKRLAAIDLQLTESKAHNQQTGKKQKKRKR